MSSKLIELINSNITANGSKSITGTSLNKVLLAMVSEIDTSSTSDFKVFTISDATFQNQNGETIVTIRDVYMTDDVLELIQMFMAGYVILFIRLSLGEISPMLQVHGITKVVFNGNSYDYRLFSTVNGTYCPSSTASSVNNVYLFAKLMK